MPDQKTIQRFVERRPRLTQLLFFLAGGLTMLSFAPFGLYPASLLLLLPFVYSSFSLSARRAAWHGFWYGAGLFLAGTYWLYISIHVFGEAPLWVAVFIMLALVMIMGLYYALAGWLINKFAAGHPERLLIAAPAVWVAVEWLRGWFLSGFPWMSLGYSQIDSPLAGFAPLVGVYGLSAMLVLSATALLVAVVMSDRLRTIAAIIAVMPWISGALLEQLVWTERTGTDVRTTIVQGGIAQDRKWSADQFSPTLDLYGASIQQHADSDLIVWPEVALPAVIDQVEEYLLAIERHLRVTDRTLMLGILERDRAENKIYNSMLMLGGESRQIYRKRHLVPFGEFFPVPDFVRRWMRMMSLPNSDLNRGNASQPLMVTRGGTTLAVAICYEDAYGAEQLSALPEASILINVSNDAWFGDSIAPHQHLEIARMRALEVGRYVVRSTNNGISAFIGPQGDLLEIGPQFTFVTMTRDITPLTGMTPYARLGNWPVVTLCFLVMGGLFVRTRGAGEFATKFTES